MKTGAEHFRPAIEAALAAQHSEFDRLLLAATLARAHMRACTALLALTAAESNEEALRHAVAEYHLRVFRAWLIKTLPEQRRDLAGFRTGEHPGAALEWLIRLACANLVPAQATAEESALFQSDLDVALDLTCGTGDLRR
jgi:hypothetical protein